MPEKLLTAVEAARKLGVSRTKFYRLRTRLVAKGMQERIIGQQRRYREASLDRMIAAEEEAVTTLV